MSTIAPLLASITMPMFAPPRFAPSLAPQSETIAAALKAEAELFTRPSPFASQRVLADFVDQGREELIRRADDRAAQRAARKVRMARKRRRGYP